MVRALLKWALAEARAGDPEALAWLYSGAEIGADSRFTLIEVCAHLRLDPARVRALVQRKASSRRAA